MMEETIRTRLRLIYESVQSSITAAQCTLKEFSNSTVNINELELIGAKLKGATERLVNEIHNYCDRIKKHNVEEITQYTTTQIEAEDLVSEIDVVIKRNIRKSSMVNSSNSGQISNIASNLPRIELTKFDGNILKWYQFWDQFSSNVDSRNISDVDKLLYLKSVLEGDAKQAVEGLDSTNRNYQIAVDTLKERFGKLTMIIDAHYVALYRIKTVTSNQIKECRQVLNEIERHLRVLSSLGEDVNHNHLRVMIMEKFPEDLIYELRMKLVQDDESIENIRKYLEYIISARETSSRLFNGREANCNQISTQENRVSSENFTTSAMHIQSDAVRDNRERRYSNFKLNKPRFNDKHFDKLSPRKRFRDNYDRSDEPPKKKDLKCIFCKQGHFNDECTKYVTIRQRRNQLGYRCFICLKEGHGAKTCRQKAKCCHCNKYGLHNRALCPKKIMKSQEPIRTNNLHIRADTATTILQTCVVSLCNSEDESKQRQCRALLDSGSQRSYITESLATSLNLSIIEINDLSIFTFGAKTPHQIKSSIVKFKIRTRTNVTRLIYANVVSHITDNIRSPIFKDSNPIVDDIRLKDLILADDGSYGDAVDILIGNDYYHSFMLTEKFAVSQNLFLVNTEFGWVWSGKVMDGFDHPSYSDQLTVLTYFQSDEVFNEKLTKPDIPLNINDVKKIWELESIGIIDAPTSSRDEEALKHFNETVIFENDRYHVQWPWNDVALNLTNNLGLAWGRLKGLIKRLNSKEKRAYNEVIQEQLKLGMIEVVPNDDIGNTERIHYLPHHCVYSHDKPTKIRVVYDASAKTGDSLSLNECLYRGPLMLEDLTGLLIKFREHPIGIIADVEKAFLQLGLQERDRDVTRFLWLKNIDGEVCSENIAHLRFCRVPFGVISSPFLLNAAIRYHLSKSNNIIMRQMAEDIYVDNVVTGARSVSEAKLLYNTSKQYFESISMNLREWNSNSKELITSIPEQFRANYSKRTKVLGLMWDVDNDSMYLNDSKTNLSVVRTKRDVLKAIASIYDPSGMAVPITTPAKHFFQNLWKEKIKWDTKLNDNLVAEWSQISSKFINLKNIHTNRYYCEGLYSHNYPNNLEHELHCFTDSSLSAYAAVVYLRSSSRLGTKVSFVIGKSRLVPLKDQKDLQIPKLELLGVLIGCRLIKYVLKFLRMQIKRQYLWTDSQVVLSWIKSEKLLPPFVSRRVTEIKDNKYLNIRYVPSKLNSADVTTKSDRVDDYKIWLEGPEFLGQSSLRWPTYPKFARTVRTEVCVVNDSLQSELPNRTQETRNESELVEVNDDETKQIIDIQRQFFPKETKGVVTDLARSLHLYRDERGIIRCKGRLKHTDFSHDQKEPILLPKNSEFTHEIIRKLHLKNYHVGVSHTLALLRQIYWVPQGRSIVQKIIKRCPQCVKYGGGPFKLPSMPDLPMERVRLSLPFAFTGLDYFGPLFVNEGTNEKRWICLLTCLTVRAIHLEVVKDLSAEECLLAIRRFIAVRGFPQLIISDNATQFKLTASVFSSDYCIENKVRWKFIPELAPWFGGFYERLIGLVKNSMKRTIDKHILTHNQLCTVIKELEAVVNTRPLTTVGSELEHVLSPIDFLRVGGPVTTQISDKEFLEKATATKSNLIDNWKRGQIIFKEFTNMFNNQYLTSLRERSDKHKQPRILVKKLPKIGEAVQIKGDGNRVHWRVGIISEVVKGSDGQIRVAKVKLQNGETLTRSIGHIYPLEIEVEDDVTEQNPKDKTVQLTPEDAAQSDPTPQPNTSGRDRPIRISAVKGRETIRNWTAQLMSSLFEPSD